MQALFQQHLLIKKLFENYKHIKWHTVDYFWNELATVLKEENFTIINKPTNYDITNITHYESYRTGQKNKQYFGITLKYKNGIELQIRNEPYVEELFFGCFKENNEAFSKRIESQLISHSKMKNLKSNSYWIFWKVFFAEYDKRVKFSDFTHEGTFNLINKEYRTARIKEIVEEVKVFAAILEEI